MGTAAGRRRFFVVALGVSLLVLGLALATLNAFNLNFLNPASPTQTLVFIALSTVSFLLFVGVLVLLVRNVLKLYQDQRSRVLGTRLRTRMLWGAVLVSLVPLVFMFLFSYVLMNRAVDRWFSEPVTHMRDNANIMAAQLTGYAAANARAEADSIAVGLASVPSLEANTPVRGQAHGKEARGKEAHGKERLRRSERDDIVAELQRHEITLQGGFAIVYRDNRPFASLHMPRSDGHIAQLKALKPATSASDENPSGESPIVSVPVPGPPESTILQVAQRNDGSIYGLGTVDYTLATAGMKRGGSVVVGLPIPPGIASTTLSLRAATDAYWTLFRERRIIRNLYMFLLLLTTALALFACCWLALNVSKQVTRPVESLADAMEAIAAGDYARRVGQSATEELGELVDSFNAMASDLESSRALAEQSTAQLSEANIALQARRTELETIIETIPNGVVTLSADERIVVANRAFSELLDPGGQKRFAGASLADVFPRDVADSLNRLLRRSHRMGSASAEMQMSSNSGAVHLSATIALLESTGAAARQHLGYVLVLENVTELLRAQKQSAWKEVARRVAHEIKNPLTPISLNAEQIRRHIERLVPVLVEHGIETTSPAVIHRGSEIITASVETMRSLVDQFSALAQFPSARPHPADLNTIVENSLALFAGRMTNIRVVRNLGLGLPLVLADPEALKRALSNLIDNAAEAMHDSLLREMYISTRLLDSGMVELAVADTGPGLTDDMRERLFLPYFSTKQRGTGLGLSIAAQILQEHEGSIRAEKNLPAGAKFIMELRPASNLEGDLLDANATAFIPIEEVV
ncbi:MAG: ATP-binding protein [Acidobacteriota bacterium]|nr:ATP-binding protein [Acidobacteriota bacterium]